jgi:hypothetical protein
MRKNIEPAARYIEFIQRVSIESIQPFKERPSKEKEKDKVKEDDDLCASDLFSLFTADIINEKVTFTR